MTAENKNALIIFSRLPIGKETKTRLSPLLNEKQREELHLAMWHDIFSEVMKLKQVDVFLCWTGSGDVKDYMKFIPSSFHLMEQTGINLGERMKKAMKDIMKLGYKRAVIIGSDIPSVKTENIACAFDALNTSNVVIGPSGDGGYWLVGMNKFVHEIFDIESWGNAEVLAATIRRLQSSGLTYEFIKTLQDIDTPDDIIEFLKMNYDENSLVHTYLRTLVSVGSVFLS